VHWLRLALGNSVRSCLKSKLKKRRWAVAQVVKCSPSKCKALTLNSNKAKKKKKKKKERKKRKTKRKFLLKCKNMPKTWRINRIQK
jgi:hypothetical protein